MKEILINKLHQYLKDNNPDLLLQLESEGKISSYLSDSVDSLDLLLNYDNTSQPQYIIEEACMDILTYDLKPSKYNYIHEILEEEFSKTYQTWHESGILQFEAINIVTHCQPVFDEIGFTVENEDSHDLYYAITGAIHEYIQNNSEKEKLPEAVNSEL